MRITLNLSDLVGKQLKQTAGRLADGNASLVADIALGQFLALPEDHLDRVIARRRLERKATTRNGWTEAFWTILGQEMGIVDRIDNPYTARNYGDFYVVLLLSDVGRGDADSDPFVFQVAPQIWTAEDAHKHRRFRFERMHSPISAAEEVSSWLRDVRKEK